MFKLKRSKENPILLPSNKNAWEAEAVFNGCIIKEKKKFHILYRAMSEVMDHRGFKMRVSSIGYGSSGDRIHFKRRRQLIRPERDWEIFGCEDPRVTKLDGKYYIFYTALSTYPFSTEGIKVGLAITRDFKTIEAKHPVTPFNSKAMAVFSERVNGKIAAVLTVNTDRPPAKIAIAFFDKESDIWSKKYWENWYASLDSHVIPLLRSPNDHLEVGAPPIKTENGWLLIYSYIKNYLSSPKTFGIEAVLLDLENPLKITGRTEEPMLIPEKEYELRGKVPNVIFPSGALAQNRRLFVYYGAADTSLCMATGGLKDLLQELQVKKRTVFIKSKDDGKKFRRFKENPIIAPRPEFSWEVKATFNPAAIYEGGKIHLVYRAMSKDNTSVLGYAASRDGVHIDERLSYPIYVPREDFEKKARSGNSGCEDPRITKIGDRLYMCYTAFNGAGPPRVALTSIKVKDFLGQRWRWKKAILISPPEIDDKDACILSKKINGKYVVFHRTGTCICLSFVPDLDFEKNKWLKRGPLIEPREDKWDNRKVGIAGPPIETKDGWLLFYHGISDPGGIYKVGAALLELNNPTRIIARTDQPFLEPEMKYEKEGQSPNVIFPCGSAVVNGELFVYYGGADEVVGVAKTNFSELLEKVKKFRIKNK